MKRIPTLVEVMQMYPNYMQMIWLGWKSALHQHFIAITEETWESSYLMVQFWMKL